MRLSYVECDVSAPWLVLENKRRTDDGAVVQDGAQAFDFPDNFL